MNDTNARKILAYLKRIDASINGPRPKRQPGSQPPRLPTGTRSVSSRLDALDTKVGALGKETIDLGGKIEKLDTRVSEVQLGLATLAVNVAADFKKVAERLDGVDKRFGVVDKRLDGMDVRFGKADANIQKVHDKIDETQRVLVQHMECIHAELSGRIGDLEVPTPGGAGGSGRGSGGGVPLAS